MKISKLIERLEKIKNEYGDIHVDVPSMNPTNRLKNSESASKVYVCAYRYVVPFKLQVVIE